VAIPVEPLWSQDGKELYYVKGDSYGLGNAPPSTFPVIARFDVGMEKIRLLTSAGEIGVPLIRDWAVSENGQYFLLATDPAFGFLEGGMWLVDVEHTQH